ncbi:XRE family transcriptional regulator [Leuconostoc carnosum]|uniref:XRE family transcriptional regulator n=1 Tax=Leuconostoc carnosum TaxID=1252 RepID=UPI0012391C5F|nr:XRE family transcriptional regulator [Leuconostoc carnosum]KAA8368039.1 XRE family transcriptional regulator [Leuconostoc carnosum]KAA8381230.1 XRE family transcriptional regulator [Leuconostoc carnosum]
MNNLIILQQLTEITTEEIAQALDAEVSLVKSWQNEEAMPTIADFEALSGIFSSQLDAKGIEAQTANHPIHIRLSMDYLMNLGLTVSDWISLKWASEGEWQGDKLAVGFFDQGKLTRVVESSDEFVAAFAGYLILQTEGEFEPYIDEYDDDKVYDWRLLRMSENTYRDVTREFIATDLPEISYE